MIQFILEELNKLQNYSTFELVLIILCSFIPFVLIFGKAYASLKVDKDKENVKVEYDKSLFRYLSDVEGKIFQFNKYSFNELDEVLGGFYEISKKILELNNSYSGISNMHLIESLAYHEKNALIKVVDSLNVGVLLSNENIQDALMIITEGLNKHYVEFCSKQTSEVEEETYILKVLQRKESERLKLLRTGCLEEHSKQSVQ